MTLEILKSQLKELNAAIAHLALVPNSCEEKLERMYARRTELIKQIENQTQTV